MRKNPFLRAWSCSVENKWFALLTSEKMIGEDLSKGKIAFAGLLALLLEAAKLNVNRDAIQATLEDSGLNDERADIIGKGHGAYMEAVRSRLDFSSLGAAKILAPVFGGSGGLALVGHLGPPRNCKTPFRMCFRKCHGKVKLE